MILEKIRNFILKLQNLPDAKKKIILVTAVVLFAVIMGFFWIKSAAYDISRLGNSLKSVDLPKIDMPNIQTNPSVPTSSPENQTVDTSAPLSTDSWKTYTNNKYGFEIKYPSDWEILSSDELSTTIVKSDRKTNILDKGNGDVWMNFGIVESFYPTVDGPEETNMSKWIQYLKSENNNFKTTVVAGQEAITDTVEPTPQSPGNIIYNFMKNKVGYNVVILYPKISDGLGAKILSTFKFTH